jgi:hypothetical protein
MVDLWLLASCEFVIGLQGSSYSRVAILLNGSPRCKVINHPLGTLQYGLYQWNQSAGGYQVSFARDLGDKAGDAPRDGSR